LFVLRGGRSPLLVYFSKYIKNKDNIDESTVNPLKIKRDTLIFCLCKQANPSK